jgi:2-polyprenyl-3-methyl-5-hydroxy-6-metoxy-1,4-benzoquinol methylase
MDNLKQNSKGYSCWVCGSKSLKLIKSSDIRKPLESRMFSISDSHYGTTSDIYRCENCGFLQCSSLNNELPFYEKLKDCPYESSRWARELQFRKILNIVRKYRAKGKLLDVGAGSGILVEQAIDLGYDAEGIEPSGWLVNKAKEYNLPIHLGILPHQDIQGPYDIVTLIDVIEHVSDPRKLLSDIQKLINREGIIIVVTPDVGSFFARIMGWKWWHFRLAHLGYFNKKTFKSIFNATGFKLIKMLRPTWYLPLDYLIERLNTYLPRILRVPVRPFFRKIVIPLNLRDSILGIFSLKQEEG